MGDKSSRKKSFFSISDIIKEEKSSGHEKAINLSKRSTSPEGWNSSTVQDVKQKAVSNMRMLTGKASSADSGYGSASPSPDCTTGQYSNFNLFAIPHPPETAPEARDYRNSHKIAATSLPEAQQKLLSDMNRLFLLQSQGHGRSMQDFLIGQEQYKIAVPDAVPKPQTPENLLHTFPLGLYYPAASKLNALSRFVPPYFPQQPSYLPNLPYLLYHEQLKLMMSLLQKENTHISKDHVHKNFSMASPSQELRACSAGKHHTIARSFDSRPRFTPTYPMQYATEKQSFSKGDNDFR